MSFWMTGQSFQKHQYSHDKRTQFAEPTNRLHSSPYSVDKYNCWSCCAVIEKAWTKAGRRLVMIVPAVYCLPIKIITCSAYTVTAGKAVLPHRLSFQRTHGKPSRDQQESPASLSCSAEKRDHDFYGKMYLRATVEIPGQQRFVC